MPLKRLRKKARQNKLNDSNELTGLHEPTEPTEPMESTESTESTELIEPSIETGLPKIKVRGDKTRSTDNKYKSLIKKKQSKEKWERNYA